MDSHPSPPRTSLPISDTTTTTQPRRAVKACASCRRDKIRCDGAKPCGGCVKKGYTFDQCIEGCENCRKARVRCEGGKPCIRCRDMHLDCAEEQNIPAVRSDAIPPILVLRSNRHKNERAKLACQNCRRDNKKCDDQRPCSRCATRGEDCVHVGRGPKLVKLRCESCRRENRKCEDARPCRQCAEQGQECINVQRKGRGHGTRVKAACTNCRRDKVRCEGVRPCVTCVRKGYQCIDRVCAACVRQGVDGECPHRAGPEQDALDGDEISCLNPTYVTPHPSPVAPPQPSQMAMAPSMFPQMYGLPPYHILVAQPLGMANQALNDVPPAGYPRTAYYPVFDPRIDAPQQNISSERYDPSLASTGPSSSSS
ncbi:hypothetical protein F5I97DRAFT_1839388 [Phlebopus sp. FC_14]|nr:hypothetical protein F5I97DRAFT_1839388 [Phlebopus sp. FC_14]